MKSSDLHDELRAALRPWEQRDHFAAGDAATDVMAVLVAWGLVHPDGPS